MPILAVKCRPGRVIEMNGQQRFCRKEGHVFFDVPVPSVNTIKTWNTNPCADLNLKGVEAFCVPEIGIVEFREEAQSKAGYSVWTYGCIAVDWGGTVETLVSSAVLLHEKLCVPIMLDTTEMKYRGLPASAAVYRDNGIRLAVSPKGRGEPAYFGIAGGYDAKLGKLDVGNKSLLTVAINDIDLRGKLLDRLVVIDENAESVLELSGDCIRIADGLVEKTDIIEPVSGLEKRMKYEYKNGAFALVSEDIGRFQQKQTVLIKDTEITLDFILKIKSSLFSDARKHLSDELSESLDDETIKSFFGSFETAVLRPDFIKPEAAEGSSSSLVVAGLLDEMPSVGFVIRPRQFEVSFEDGRITDIEALDE